MKKRKNAAYLNPLKECCLFKPVASTTRRRRQEITVKERASEKEGVREKKEGRKETEGRKGGSRKG